MFLRPRSVQLVGRLFEGEVGFVGFLGVCLGGVGVEGLGLCCVVKEIVKLYTRRRRVELINRMGPIGLLGL